MLTLFLSISGGVSWVEALDPLSSLVAYHLGSMKLSLLLQINNSLKGQALYIEALRNYKHLGDVCCGNLLEISEEQSQAWQPSLLFRMYLFRYLRF